VDQFSFVVLQSLDISLLMQYPQLQATGSRRKHYQLQYSSKFEFRESGPGSEELEQWVGIF
jgi:hypothetical protein